MSYGFQAFNSSSKLIADTNAFSLHYLGQATWVSGGGGPWGLYQIFEIASANGPPLVFLNGMGSNYFGLARVYLYSGSTYRIEVLCRNPGGWDDAINVYCFAQLSSNSPASSYGLQVFNGSGSCVFDSTRNPLSIHSVFDATATSGGGHIIQQYSYPSLTTTGVFVGLGARRILEVADGLGTLVTIYGGAWYFEGGYLKRGAPIYLEATWEDYGPVNNQTTTHYNEKVIFTDLAKVL